MMILEMPCNPANYGGLRGQKVGYIVIHYTAGRNDTAVNNGAYFGREAVGASAHYFVDEYAVVRSVPEDHVAWHCGGTVYRHPDCRNGNSIGVEICCKYENGVCRFAPAAVERAKSLVRLIMEQYEIPAERVLRHYDVTGKVCPAPFVGAGKDAWERFKGGLTVYQKQEQVPDWAKDSVRKLVERGALTGDGEGNLNLSQELTRTLVILDRLGLFDRQEEAHE